MLAAGIVVAAASGRPEGVAVTGQHSGEELPAAAEARMEEMRESGTWGSSLSTAEFAAIRSVSARSATMRSSARAVERI